MPTGVADEAGWPSCMIPADENSKGGSSLGTFYKTNRVLAGDQFLVWIAP